MSGSGKIITSVLIVFLILLSIAVSSVAYYYFVSEKAKRISLEKQLSETQAAKTRLETEINSYKDKITDLDNQLAESKIAIDELTTELDADKIAQQENISERDQLLSERNNLLNELKEKASSLGELNSKLTSAREEINALKEQIAQLKLGPASSEDVAQLDKIELGKIVVASSGAVKGEILSINKDHNFVVVNLGKLDGINIGQVLTVAREKSTIGHIKVIRIQEDLSIADVLEDTKISSLREGDKVAISDK